MKAWLAVNNTIVEKEVDLNLEKKKILVKVKAFGLNRADLSQIEGNYFPPEGVTEILGLEFSGIVEKSFEGSLFKEGDRVMGLVQGGAYAEYVITEEETLVKLPEEIDFIRGASLPEAWGTVLLNLKDIGNIKEGQRILLHSATGSIGPVAIQYAKYCNCYVIVTTRSVDKISFLKAQGADEVYLYSELKDSIDNIKNNGGVDFILDPVGKDTLFINQKLLNLNGTLVSIGNMSGGDANINLNLLLIKRQKIIGSTLRSQPLEVRKRLMSYLNDLLSDIILNKFDLPISKVYEWTDICLALNYMKQNKNRGKIIISLMN